jgi:hypothetical protein
MIEAELVDPETEGNCQLTIKKWVFFYHVILCLLFFFCEYIINKSGKYQISSDQLESRSIYR